MSSQLHISIPEPCAMRWEEMSHVTDAQRHCSSCNKVIIDFTKMSDAELIAHFSRNAVSCGKFAPHQLNTAITEPKKQQKLWPGLLLLTALTAASRTEARAQQAPRTEQISDSLNAIEPETVVEVNDTLIISGSVVGEDYIDSTATEALSGAVVTIHLADGTVHGCVTDQGGKFTMKLPGIHSGDSAEMEVRYTGYTRYRTRIILNDQITNVAVQIQPAMIGHTMGVIVYDSPRSRVRHFFWKLFHPRYWFNR